MTSVHVQLRQVHTDVYIVAATSAQSSLIIKVLYTQLDNIIYVHLSSLRYKFSV